MDNLNIPACAMYRQIGTVIVKTDDVQCSRTCLGDRGDPRTYAKCEQCRTTTNSPYSDCDSDIVKRCRTYRSSTARSRYVNVCAAVCLLLLVGGLSPQSSAAPHKRSNMEDAQLSYEKGKTLWENPCNYHSDDSLSNGLPQSATVFEANTARRVANQAKNALHTAEEFKDLFAKNMYGFATFEELVSQFNGTQWLRGPNYEDFVGKYKYTLPLEKTRIGKQMPDDYVNEAVAKIDEFLPYVHKTLKLVVAALYDVKGRGLDAILETEVALQTPFDALMNRCRQTLCYMNDLMASRKVSELPLAQSELPDVRSGGRLLNVMMTYRDTMLFLDWLAQLMYGLAAHADGTLPTSS